MARRTLVPILVTIAIALLGAAPGDGLAQTPTSGAEDLLGGPDAFSPVVSNPFFPLASLRYKLLEGDFEDPETGEVVHERVEERVLPETATIAGIEVTVVEVTEYADGELTERTLDYYAQHEDGTVYYFGEDVDNYEDGEMVGHAGAWVAGEGNNQPGVFMPAAPDEGQTFEQERAPGIAEDTSTVVATGQRITVAAGTFDGCIKTEDVNPLDDETEFKFYCPGVGIVREQGSDGTLDLVRFAGGSPATPTAS